MTVRSSLASRIRRPAPAPRVVHAAAVAEHFSHLDTDVVDHFFENFGFTMPLSLVSRLDRLCRARRPDLVVEFGAGVSTTVLADAVAPYGGFLLSVEADAEWLGPLRDRISQPQRVGFLVFAAGRDEDDRLNYPRLSELIRSCGRPGLVVIDGPAVANRFSPAALDAYRTLLSADCVVATDDTDRAENDEAAARLAQEFSLEKRDYGDPLFLNHRYSILYPAGTAED